MKQVEEQTQEWTKIFKGSRKRPKNVHTANQISYISTQIYHNPMAPEQILFLLENLLEKDLSNRYIRNLLISHNSNALATIVKNV